MTQEIVEAISEVEAAKIKMKDFMLEDSITLEEIKNIAFNGDFMISVIKI